MTADAITNGHAPAQAAPPQPDPQSALNAVHTRSEVLRQTIKAREDELDYLNAMYMTVCGQRDQLAAENSRLQARLVELGASTDAAESPEGAAGN